MELKKTISNQTLPLRLQAYERIVLFMERVNPANMLMRLNGPAIRPPNCIVLWLRDTQRVPA